MSRTHVDLAGAFGILLMASTAVAQVNTPPDAIFRTTPDPDGRGRIAGYSPLEVTFNMCPSTDPDEGDELKFTYDWEGDGEVDFFGHCRATHVYTNADPSPICSDTTVCVSDRQPDHATCRTYKVCTNARGEGPLGVPRLLAVDGVEDNAAAVLYEINPTTGTATAIGPTGIGCTTLAQAGPGGTLYCVNGFDLSNANVATINPTTGAGTVVTPVAGGGYNALPDGVFRGGTFYVWNEDSDFLSTLDPATGVLTNFPRPGISTYGSGLAFTSDGRLFLTYRGINGSTAFIDPGTGTSTAGPTLSGCDASLLGEPITGLSLGPDGVLYGVVNTYGGPSSLVTVNPDSGACAVVGTVGSLPVGMDALEWVTY
jgi:hypothetical protein